MTAPRKQTEGRISMSAKTRSTAGSPARSRNRLLRLIPDGERARLAPHLETVTLEAMQVLAEAHEPLRYVYFPENTMISLLRRMRDGTAIEVGAVGYDGMAGLPVAIGVTWSPTAFVAPIPGECRRMPASVLRSLLPELPGFSALLGRYAMAFANELSHTIACNALHSVEQRCTRWLLTAHEWVGRDELQLTHGVLAQLLGVRRAGVTVAALALQRAGFIAYTRGRVVILDHAGLEAVSCECRSEMRADAKRILDPLNRPPTAGVIA